MKKHYIFAAVGLAVLSVLPGNAVQAETISTQPVLIAAVQTGQVGAAGNDFVVLHNTTDTLVDITGWKLQYRAASAVGTAAWVTKRTIACIETTTGCTVVLGARLSLVLATYDIPGIERQPFTSGFSDTGGQLRLVRPGAVASQLEVIDAVGYGSAAESEVSPAAAPQAGQAIVRKQTTQHGLIDTNDNAADFDAGCYVPTASEVPAAVSCEAPVIEQPDTDTPQPQEPVAPPPTTEPDQPVSYASLFITELLPDPESPAADSTDEFIELYNPNAQPVSAKGYTLQAGTDFRYQYSLGDITIPAGGFATIFSSESHLSLSNSGTAVRVTDPNGIVLDTITSYGQAKSGQSWAKGASGWQWTLTPTPGTANAMNVETPKAVLAAAAAVKKAAAKKASAATPKPTKAAAPKAAKTAASTSGSAQTASAKPQEAGTIQYWVMGSIGFLILGYALYEYRQDIVRFCRKSWGRMARHNKQPHPEPAQEPSTLRTD